MSPSIALDSSTLARPATGPVPVLPPRRRPAAHVAEVLPATTHGTAESLSAPPLRLRGHALIAYLLRIGAAIRRRWQQAGTESALHELDARTLRDIGIDRSEIASMAAEWHGAIAATRIRALRFSPHSLHG